MRALYANPNLVTERDAKKPWLEKLRADRVFLIDLATTPVNEYSAADRAAGLARNVADTVSMATALRPEGILLIKQNVFELLERPIRRPASRCSTT